ncbi:hypothetical protein Hanom_Chr17g01578041 [Helianthus anomalus]
MMSFACGFCIKAAETDRKCLECRKRVPIIHSENIFTDFPKLQNHFILLCSRHIMRRVNRSDKLEVLHRCYGHTPFEIQTPAL